MKEKKVSILLLLMIICMAISQYCYWTITVPNELKYVKQEFKTITPVKFDYLNGLWLLFSGLFFIFLLILLNVPSFEEVYKTIKKDFKKKFNV